MFWKKTDAEYIETVRRWVRWSKRFVALHCILLVAWIVILVCWHSLVPAMLTKLNLNGDQAMTLGFWFGAMTGIFWVSGGVSLLNLLVAFSKRPWSLLVDYHDRLKNAGLIEGGNAGTHDRQN